MENIALIRADHFSRKHRTVPAESHITAVLNIDIKNNLPFPGKYDILPLAVEKLQRPRPLDGKVEEASLDIPETIYGALAQMVERI